MGPDLADRMQKHAEKFGATFETGARSSRSRPTATTASCGPPTGASSARPAVIVTAGGEARKLGVPGEEEFAGKGVSYCAVCDGAFFEGADIAVVGGGDSAVEEGTFLTRYGEQGLPDPPPRRTTARSRSWSSRCAPPARSTRS